ncbi:hypothetical protein F5X98DRAFT_335315 [Xylaria grammica]|nr:hypothetical protein F5X98DRAFT_335315 [Xylaria grammica]
MSGFEVAGILLGAFPLIISGLERWRDVAQVGNFYWRIRKEYSKCRSDVQFYEIWYKRNLKELLLPIMDVDDVNNLVKDPGGKEWCSKILEARLEQRLQESYGLYMQIIREMNETALELKKEISPENETIQNKLSPPTTAKQRRPSSSNPLSQFNHTAVLSTRSRLTYEAFRIKFSFNGPIRHELFEKMKEYNERLEKLLSTSDKISSLQNTVSFASVKQSALESMIKQVPKKSDLLFRALQKAWQCPCQEHHSAHLRLEHRAPSGICFEIILTFTAPSSQMYPRWEWREMKCMQVPNCSPSERPMKISTKSPSLPSSFGRTSVPAPRPPAASSPSKNKKKVVAFTPPSPSVSGIQLNTPLDPGLKLCQLLSDQTPKKCIGVIGHDDEEYHLHPFTKRKVISAGNGRNPITLDHILSSNYEGYLSRRQRYSIALLLASSVAQLQSTAWLRADLTKQDIFFFPSEVDGQTISYHEPFIHQDFLPYDHNHAHHTISNTSQDSSKFYSLGILLLELCFGRRLEDSPHRKNYPTDTGDVKNAFDLMAALKWSRGVSEEGGDDYASAVKWCFMGANYSNQSWRSEIVKNVIRPLEVCQEHFKTGLGI